MVESQSKVKAIDKFLSKNPKAMQRMQAMLLETKEFPCSQNMLYRLMELTGDVQTFSQDLVHRLTEDYEIASKIIEKAKLQPVFSQTKITTAQLKKAIQRLGYDLVHNEIQRSLAAKYVEAYFQTENQEAKVLIRKSVRLALVTFQVAKMLKVKNTTKLFFAAMNYYIGQVIIALREPMAYGEIAKMIARGVDLKSAQMTVLGFDLADLEEASLKAFALPEAVVDLVSHSSNLAEMSEENLREAVILKFSEYISDTLNNKKASPQTMWARAHDYLKKINSDMKMEQWIAEIKLIYIRVLEEEFALFKR